MRIPFLDGSYEYEPSDDRPRAFYQPRQLSLTVASLDRTEAGAGWTTGQHWDNLDALLGLFHSEDLVILAYNNPEGHRFLKVRLAGQASVAHRQRHTKTVQLQLEAPYPFWRSVAEYTTAAGSSISQAGNAPIAAFVVTFGGAGTLTHTQSGAALTVSSACVVDVGKRTVTTGGVPTPEKLTRNRPWWMRFPAGAAAGLTGSGSVAWRDHWF